MTVVTASLTSKAQLTLPKRVREFLGVGEKGDQIGFLLDEKTRRIVVTRMALVPDESYTDAEIRNLFKLAKAPGGRTFESADALLKHLHRL